ncbi:MAG: exo-alpha-sialidase [Candidatus Kerfeldbacteria bacterium]|nr:exo-alpha-sialidase [Candidatus Kerfeldbacteria bacterium]
MLKFYASRKQWIALFSFLLVVVVVLPLVVIAKPTFKKVKNLSVEYSATDDTVQVSWSYAVANRTYIVKVISDDETLDTKTTKKKHANFDAALFDDGNDYTIQVRVKGNKNKSASAWKKTSYTHTLTGDAEPCPTTGISHDVYVTSSSDPSSFTDADTPAITYASVPDGVLLQQTTTAGDAGDILVYFVRSGICMSKSSDNGATWSDPLAVNFDGLDDSIGAYDPSLIQLEDGTLRMYFFGSTVQDADPASMEGEHPMYSALSDDGVNFTMEDDERLSVESITDPEVLRLNDTWIMYVSNGSNSLIATSTNGLDFTLTGSSWSGGGIPGVYVDEDDTVHIYGCSGGVNTATSTDGINFGNTTSGVIPQDADMTTCDPSPVLLNDGTILMVYKKQDNSSGGDTK